MAQDDDLQRRILLFERRIERLEDAVQGNEQVGFTGLIESNRKLMAELHMQRWLLIVATVMSFVGILIDLARVIP